MYQSMIAASPRTWILFFYFQFHIFNAINPIWLSLKQKAQIHGGVFYVFLLQSRFIMHRCTSTSMHDQWSCEVKNQTTAAENDSLPSKKKKTTVWGVNFLQHTITRERKSCSWRSLGTDTRWQGNYHRYCWSIWPADCRYPTLIIVPNSDINYLKHYSLRSEITCRQLFPIGGSTSFNRTIAKCQHKAVPLKHLPWYVQRHWDTCELISIRDIKVIDKC
jgi:hypothetical protein